MSEATLQSKEWTIWACPHPDCEEFDTQCWHNNRASISCAYANHPEAVRVEVVPASELERVRADLEHERTEASRYQDERNDAEEGREEIAAKWDAAEAKLAEVRAEVERAEADAQLGNGGEMEDPLANIKAILDSSPSVSGGDESSGVRLDRTALSDKLDAIEGPSKGLKATDDYERGIQWVVGDLRRWLGSHDGTAKTSLSGQGPALDEIENAIWREYLTEHNAEENPECWPQWLIGAALTVKDLMEAVSLSGDVEERGEEGAEALAKRFWELRSLGEQLPSWDDLPEEHRQSKLMSARAFIAEHFPTAFTTGNSLEDLKFGPRFYTPEQARVITEVVADRRPLPTGNSLSGEPGGQEQLREAVKERLIEDQALMKIIAAAEKPYPSLMREAEAVCEAILDSLDGAIETALAMCLSPENSSGVEELAAHLWSEESESEAALFGSEGSDDEWDHWRSRATRCLAAIQPFLTQPVSPQPDPTTRLSEGDEALIAQVRERFNPTRAFFDMGDGQTQAIDWNEVIGQVLHYAGRLPMEGGEEGLRERLLSASTRRIARNVLAEGAAPRLAWGDAILEAVANHLATTQKPQDEERRCGGSGWIFPEPDQPMANEKCPGCPGCQPQDEGDDLLKPKSGRWLPDDFPAEAVGFRLVRIIEPGERLRTYEAIRWPAGRSGIAQFLRQRMLPAEAYANADYALADVLDADHNIIAEFGIATKEAFKSIQYKLRAAVDSTDGDPHPEQCDGSGEGRDA